MKEEKTIEELYADFYEQILKMKEVLKDAPLPVRAVGYSFCAIAARFATLSKKYVPVALPPGEKE